MNIKSIFLAIIGVAVLGLYSCDSKRGKDISEYENAKTGDSLLFYFVQLRAHEYWENAEKDTSMRSEEARARFIKGIEKGFNSVKESDKDYNKGLQLGVQLGMNLLRFETMYDIEIDNSITIPSFLYGLRDGQHNQEFEYQEEFYSILNRLKSMQRARDHEKARQSLVDKAREHKMSKIADNLYYRISKKGEGSYPQYGQSAHVHVNFERADGHDIAVPSPGLITIGAQGIPEVLNSAYMRLNKGSVGQFITTAEALFGTRIYIMGMKPEDVLLLTITMNEIISPHALSTDSI
ncbi:MAG: hypothetical protein K2G67_00765 [Muribaculaceae bacterium]|nr:hypothetical protein [Muribaculaceae bacterium]